MSEQTSGHDSGPVSYASPSAFRQRASLVQLGGGLGIAGTILGILIFFGACAGLSASLILSPLCLILGAVGFVLAIVGGLTQKDLGIPDPQVLAAIFMGVFSIVGGLLLMAAWLGWQVFPK